MEPDQRALFNTVAEQYDRHRPGYPEAAVDDLVAAAGLQSGARLLEIGCGTGQVTELFAKRGCYIDAIELGADSVALATRRLKRYPAVRVHQTAFESFRPDSGLYNLVLSAQAFHWIDAEIRLPRCHDLLAPGGYLSLFYNYTPPQGGALDELSRRIESIAEGTLLIVDVDQAGKGVTHWTDEFSRSDVFEHLNIDLYPWEREYTTREFLDLFRTYSDFLAQPEETRRSIESLIRDAFANEGDRMVRRYECTVFRARRVAE